MGVLVESKYIFTSEGEKVNKNNFAKFKEEVAALKNTVATASDKKLHADEKAAISKLLEKFDALKDFTSVGSDKDAQEGTYVLSSFVLLPALKALHETIASFQEETASDDAQYLAQRIEKNKLLRENLEILSKATQNRLSFWKHVWWNVWFGVRTFVTSLTPALIPFILTWVGVAINPLVFAGIVIAGVVVSIGMIFGFSVYHIRQLNKLTTPSFHPIKASIDTIIDSVNKNIHLCEKQYELANKDQALHENIKAARLKFFVSPSSDMNTSECYQGLVSKRDNKVELLQIDLENAQAEIDAAETALKITSGLIENNQLEIANYEIRLLANAVTSSVRDEIKTFAENRFRQTIAVRLAKEKKAMLEAAIHAHNDPAYLPDKFDKYQSEVYAEEEITKISHQRDSQNAYGAMLNGEFYPTDMKVSTRRISNPYKNSQLTLFKWHNDHSKNISSVHSLKLNIKINQTAEKIEADVASERKQWAGIK